MKTMYVYILSNKKNGTLYVGVTSDLIRRIYEHKERIFKGFSSKYHTSNLVYFEEYDDEITAIEREKQLKKAYRKYKLNLINQFNPEWNDLYKEIVKSIS